MQPLLASEPNRVGDYRLLARLGRGAMGGVYLGRSRGGRVVAVKVVRPELAENPEFRERFRREVHSARSVGGFWTAAVVDADPAAEQPWLATEYVPGPTLHQAVSDHGPLPERTVRALAAGLAEALAAIHRAGLVHRDLKPANVLLGPDGPRVIDFGISRAMSGNALTATGMFLGTPGFFSPEQTTGDEVGPPSDVFSLGAVLVFAATGSGPFGDDNTTALLYRVVHNEPDLSRVPAGLRPLLAACLAKDPAARPTPAGLLDMVGEPRPQGNQWLPAAITDVIAQHATELQRTANAPLPDAPPPDVPPPAPAPANSVRTAPVAPPTPVPPANGAPIVAKRPRGTVQQTAEQVRRDLPGPVFRTRGKVPAALSALACVAIMVAARWMAARTGVSMELSIVYRLGVLLLSLSALWSLIIILLPGLRLKINADGLVVSRMGLHRGIPWHHVRRAAIVGSGKNQWIAVWSADDAPPLTSRPWHRVRTYHGGSLLFPIGATGGVLSRRKRAKRARQALQQHSRGRYDDRLL
ncbi:serine/threonine-protein kinase [Saccharopolyspora rosea]|uniref:Serine/threonine-protein kinase n=1 Tax=Saccharopolyspora rosea TaxID=524884 RepID=A0ABW3FPZ2_9PSEU|nr:serine/threonine-protein kinase [Saccharopolyspora rosea]